MRQYHQHQRKVTYAHRTYEWKKQFFGLEKPDFYSMLVKHYRHAIADAITNVPKHNKVLFRDKYFMITYNVKEGIFETLSLRTAKQHKNINYAWRLQEVLSKERYLKWRLKFWNTERLEELGHDMQNYAYELDKIENEYEAASINTIEDILAELLYNVAFIPVGKMYATWRIEKSLELKNKDLASSTWVDMYGGVSLDGYADHLLQEANTNGLSEVGYAINESEYGGAGNISQHMALQDEIRDFISRYSSSSAYFRAKRDRIKEIEKRLHAPNKELSEKYHMYIDKRNCWLLLVVIDSILNERTPYRTEHFMSTYIPSIETSVWNMDDLLDDAHKQDNKGNNTEDDVPF